MLKQSYFFSDWFNTLFNCSDCLSEVLFFRIFKKHLNKNLILFIFLSQIDSKLFIARFLSAYIDRCFDIKNALTANISLEILIDFVLLLLLNVAVQQKGCVIFIIPKQISTFYWSFYEFLKIFYQELQVLHIQVFLYHITWSFFSNSFHIKIHCFFVLSILIKFVSLLFSYSGSYFLTAILLDCNFICLIEHAFLK